MKPQFKDKITFRSGALVEVQVHYAQGIAGKMSETMALGHAVELINRRLGELGADQGE